MHEHLIDHLNVLRSNGVNITAIECKMKTIYLNEMSWRDSKKKNDFEIGATFN